MKSLIYGYGETGKSFERYLNKNNEKFEIFDNNLAILKKNLIFKILKKFFVVLESQKIFIRNYLKKIKIYIPI